MIEDAIKSVVGSYSDITKSKCASFALVSNDSRQAPLIVLTYVCHAPLTYPWPAPKYNTWDHLITSYPVKSDDHLDFFEFIKNVLYKQWSDVIQLEQTTDGKYYIHVTDLSKIPANVLYNFCICSRTIVEYPARITIWRKLCKKGLHPAFAFAVCRADSAGKLNQIVGSPGEDSEHCCFYMAASLDRLIVSGPVSTAVSYKTNPTAATPTNIIWGEAKDLKNLQGSTIRKFWNEWRDQIPA